MAGRGRGKGGWGAKSEIQKLAERQDTDGSVLAEVRIECATPTVLAQNHLHAASPNGQGASTSLPDDGDSRIR